jgi:hypothetical protein
VRRVSSRRSTPMILQQQAKAKATSKEQSCKEVSSDWRNNDHHSAQLPNKCGALGLPGVGYVRAPSPGVTPLHLAVKAAYFTYTAPTFNFRVSSLLAPASFDTVSRPVRRVRTCVCPEWCGTRFRPLEAVGHTEPSIKKRARAHLGFAWLREAGGRR